MTHQLTHTLSTLIFRADRHDSYEPVAAAIEETTDGWTDERRADLYALIQESVNKTMSFVELSDSIDHALLNNERRYAGLE
jgi:hypothetical protein